MAKDLLNAIKTKNLEKVKKSIKNVDINTFHEDKNLEEKIPIVFYAILQDDRKILEFLIEGGYISINDKYITYYLDYEEDWEEEMSTPLEYAFRKKSLNSIIILLKNGASSYNLAEKKLRLWVNNEIFKEINLLEEFLDLIKDDFRRYINPGCISLDKKIIKVLLDHGYDIDETDWEGNTLLHEAALENNLEMCKYLIENGADIKAPYREPGADWSDKSKSTWELASDTKVINYLKSIK